MTGRVVLDEPDIVLATDRMDRAHRCLLDEVTRPEPMMDADRIMELARAYRRAYYDRAKAIVRRLARS